MKFDIKKVIRVMDLNDYDPQFNGQVIQVWVNPDRAFIRERDELWRENVQRIQAIKDQPEGREEYIKWSTEEFIPRNHAWFARIWSQGSDASQNWTADELMQIGEQDPALYDWIQRRTMEMLMVFRSDEKKS